MSSTPSTPSSNVALSEFVSRFTSAALTPRRAHTAFSTRLEQAAQLMPVTLNCLVSIVLKENDYSVQGVYP